MEWDGGTGGHGGESTRFHARAFDGGVFPMGGPTTAADSILPRPLTSKEKQALRYYEEYKKMRREIGMPIRAFDDIEGILRDLCGEGFSQLEEEEIERVRGSRAGTDDGEPCNKYPYVR